MKLHSFLFSFISLLFCRSSSAFAISFPGDCNLVIGTYKDGGSFTQLDILRNKNDPEFMNLFEPILGFNNFNQAFLNLKKVCCSNNKDFQTTLQKSCNSDKPYFFEGNVPKSYYIYDHILDIMMRRLDGEDQNYYLVDELDKKGKEWRSLINSVAEQISGDEKTTPKYINDHYQNYWTLSPNNLLFGINEIPSASLGELVSMMQEPRNKELLERYEDRTLGERYYNVCNLSAFFYSLLYHSSSDIPSLSQTKSTIFNNGNNNCLSLIDKRLDEESEYTKLINITKSNMALTNSIDDYMTTYLGKRLSNLEELIIKTKILFLRVARAVPKLVSNVS